MPNFGQYAVDKNTALATKLSHDDYDIVGEEFSAPVHAMRPAPVPRYHLNDVLPCVLPTEIP